MMHEVIQKAFTLFLILDSFGVIGIVATMIKPFSPQRQRVILRREMFFTLVAMYVFYFFGTGLLNTLGISQPAVQIGGSIILFFFALGLLFPSKLHSDEGSTENPQEPFLVPIAVPLIAGPTCLATIMLYAHESSSSTVTLLAIILAWLPTAIIILLAPFLLKKLGATGIFVLERMMSLVVTLLAVDMFMNGVTAFLHTFSGT